MAIYVKDQTAWREVKEPTVRNSTAWVKLKKAHVKDQTVWREVWSSMEGTVDPGADASYVRTLPSSEFINGVDLAQAIGLTGGVVKDSDSPWMHFIMDISTETPFNLFVPMKSFRADIGWAEIYQAGAIYGTDDFGTHPEGGNRTQNARVTVNGIEYRVTLLKGGNKDSVIIPSNENQRFDVPSESDPSEWNRIMYRVSNTGNPNPASHPYGVWEQYTKQELNVDFTDSDGCASWCQEFASVNGQPRRLLRGGDTVTYFDGDHPSFVHNFMGWRPALRSPYLGP